MAKTWIRGDSWPVAQIDALHEFPIQILDFDRNQLIAPHHLTREGFPSPWSQALAFTRRLRDSSLLQEIEEPKYKQECLEAVADFLTLVVGQFLGDLRPEAHAWDPAAGDGLASSRFGRLLAETQLTAPGSTPALIVLRDQRYFAGHIAAINHPDCLWFPVYAYDVGQLRPKIEEQVGRIEAGSLRPADDLAAESSHLLRQLRSYVQQLLDQSEQRGDNMLAWGRVLSRFEDSLSRLGLETAEVPIQRGEAYVLTPSRQTLTLELRSFGEDDGGAGCRRCGRDWMNYRYRERFVLRGGSAAQREVLCPNCGEPLPGWKDLMERSVFFDEQSNQYVIWEDDPEDDKALRLPPNAVRLVVERGVADRPGRARFLIHRAEIEVEGRVMRRQEVLLRQLLEMPGDADFELLPVSAECAHFIASDGELGLRRDPNNSSSWQVRLRGWEPFDWRVEPTVDEDLNAPDNVTLLLWPGFEDPAWTAETVVYFVSFVQGDPPQLRCYWRDQRGALHSKVVTGTDIEHSVIHTQGRIEYIEWQSPAGRPLGLFSPRRKALEPGQWNEAIVALDFGTSHTTLAWSPMDRPNPQKIGLDHETTPLELLSPAELADKESVAEKISLLPFWPKHRDVRWLVPSELVFFSDSDYWTVPHESIAPSHFRHVRRDFKWHDQKGIFRTRYLNMVLRMALANLRSMGIRSIELRATYPLAFEPHHLQSYHNLLEKILSQLQGETGIDIRPTGYANESISGLEACVRKRGNLHCVVDFGGGTTDLAVRILNQTEGFTKPLYVDSVRLAGRDILDSFLADPELKTAVLADAGMGSISDSRQADDVARQILLRGLRASGTQVPEFWNLVAGKRSEAAELFSARNRALFDGVLAYIVQLLHYACEQLKSRGITPKIDVFLLGQGWGLLRLQSGKSISNPSDYVDKRLKDLWRILPGFGERPDLQAILPTEEVDYEPKLATSYGAVRVGEHQLKRFSEIEDATGRDTAFGLNVTFFDGKQLAQDELLAASRAPIKTDVESHDAWDRFVAPILNHSSTLEYVGGLFGETPEARKRWVENTMNGIISHHLGSQLAKGTSLKNSGIGLLLEKLWAQRLKRLQPPT